MKLLISVILLLVVFAPATSHADWQYTKWGMSKEQVAKAAGGQATADGIPTAKNTETSLALLQAPYQTGRYKFIAVFMFDRSTMELTEVRLELVDTELTSSLHGELTNKYGQPEKADIPVVKLNQWRDEAKNNNLSLMSIGNRHTTLIYNPIESGNNKGL